MRTSRLYRSGFRQRLRNLPKSYPDPDDQAKERLMKVIWDSGASMSISPDKKDFVGPLESIPANSKLRSLGDGVTIEGIGHVAWSFLDVKGMLRTVKLPAYYVPTASVRLLSTSSLIQEYPGEFLHGYRRGLWLSGSFGPPAPGQAVFERNSGPHRPTDQLADRVCLRIWVRRASGPPASLARPQERCKQRRQQPQWASWSSL
jgi:hypothetical protein